VSKLTLLGGTSYMGSFNYDYSRTYISPKFKNLEELKRYLSGFGNRDNIKRTWIRISDIPMYRPMAKLPDGRTNPEYARYHRTTKRGKVAENKYLSKATTKQKRKKYIALNSEKIKQDRKAWREKERARLNTLKNMDYLQYLQEDKSLLGQLKFRYKFDSYEEIIELYRNGKCEICGMTNKRHLELFNGHRLHIDHCHETGKRRGLLCQHHNSMIGYAGDNISLLQKGIEYIKKHKS
jgi:hypothetical protein